MTYRASGASGTSGTDGFCAPAPTLSEVASARPVVVLLAAVDDG